MITRKCPCCSKKTIKLLKFFETIKPLKRYNWHICSHCGAEVNSWSFGFILFFPTIILHYYFHIPTEIYLSVLVYCLFEGFISPLWMPLYVVEKTESNDLDLISKQ